MGVITSLMQGLTGVFAEQMQGLTGIFAERIQGWYLYVLRYSASVFGNSASMLIVMLDLSSYSNGYQATVAVTYNRNPDQYELYYFSYSQVNSQRQ
jgi:hypothetical protein